MNPTTPSRWPGWLENQRRWLVLGQLLLLHMGLVQGMENIEGRTMLVAHIGLFLIWQPFVRAEKRLNYFHFAVVIALVVAAIIWLNWGILVIWTMFLAGIIGGKVFVFGGRWSKFFYLAALAYLVTVLLIIIIPHLIPRSQTGIEGLLALVRFVLPFVLLGMLVLPSDGEMERRGEVIDLIYSIFVFLILAVLVLGSLAFMQLLQLDYIPSLIGALGTSALLLFLFSWTWNPLAGFSGLSSVFSRYLLSIGLPFERWMHSLAQHSQRQALPEEFLANICEDLVGHLPWVTGGNWRIHQASGTFGEQEGEANEFRHGELSIILHSSHSLSPSLIWHFNLVVQIIGQFYEAKVSARELSQMAYLKAIHETGARLTHDVKNLLQSLNMLCFAAEREGNATNLSPQFQTLVRRQLPVISQRLQLALNKLQKPVGDQVVVVAAQPWWEEQQARYVGQGVRFAVDGSLERLSLPADMFNQVIENLLQNALDKRRSHPPLRIDAIIAAAAGEAHGGRTMVTVCDDGPPIPAAVADRFFLGPVASENGYGIGLFQSARLAVAAGYRLELLSNTPGKVCFRLAPAPA